MLMLNKLPVSLESVVPHRCRIISVLRAEKTFQLQQPVPSITVAVHICVFLVTMASVVNARLMLSLKDVENIDEPSEAVLQNTTRFLLFMHRSKYCQTCNVLM
ncbi:hypothetical protein GCK32_005376 [Trichostrongylus colubriformis]|uniref:Uncharacterized protein n=1 Tax=Trichostrongylus colubriformis TaxID=6319 RepID=A0AAN8ETQ9_TRICO